MSGLQVFVTGSAGVIYSGHAAGLHSVPSSAMIACGDAEALTYVFSLPPSAGNAFQGLSQALSITYDAVQRPGAR